MILSRHAIIRAIESDKIAIYPFDESCLEAAHLNLHIDAGKVRELIIEPHGFVVATTIEKVRLSDDVCAFIQGRASLAKQGLSVEQSSTFVEPGTNSFMTLEIFNASTYAYTLEHGQPIAKMVFMKVVE